MLEVNFNPAIRIINEYKMRKTNWLTLKYYFRNNLNHKIELTYI